MLNRFFKIYLQLVAFVLCFHAPTLAQSNEDEAHTEVALRMIGHQLLLQSGDSTSRVLPVEKSGNSYTLRFANNFQFDPEILALTVDSLIRQTKIADSYRVAVKSCENEEVVYSYEIGLSKNTDIVPCLGRLQPKGCYFIQITLLTPLPYTAEGFEDFIENAAPLKTSHSEKSYAGIFGALFVIVILSGAFLLFRKKREQAATLKNLILLGAYRFDPKNMELIFNNKKTELTGKETALLMLLYTNVNLVVEKDRILKDVWGDEDDYVGRTLDVYISKLRKKLEADPRLKIVNIRGVGYKFIVDLK